MNFEIIFDRRHTITMPCPYDESDIDQDLIVENDEDHNDNDLDDMKEEGEWRIVDSLQQAERHRKIPFHNQVGPQVGFWRCSLRHHLTSFHYL